MPLFFWIGKRVVYANHIFKHSFQKDVDGRYYWEIPVLSKLSKRIDGYLKKRGCRENSSLL